MQGLDIYFPHPVYLRGIRVKFVYENQRVKVKVIGAKRSKIPFLQCKTSIGNPITPVL